ncbi:hypothetical protein Tco_0668300 [Tanacetum coccineum]
MAQLKYCDKHNQVGFLRKPDESAGFAEIVDFLRGSNLRYALTSNPTIYDSLVKQFWQTATANTKADGSLEINATIDTIRYTITEASIRDTLQLEDATGITMLPNDEIFEGMGQMGYGGKFEKQDEVFDVSSFSATDFEYSNGKQTPLSGCDPNQKDLWEYEKGVLTGSIKLSIVSEQVSTGSAERTIPSPDKGQRAGKDPMISEETPKKSKEQIG